MAAIGKREIILTHVAKSQLGLSDGEYRAALARVGVTTSKDLTLAQYRELMRHFEACGFKAASGKKKPWSGERPARSKERLLGKVWALMADLELSREYVNGMALRMYKIPQAAWLDPKQLHGLVAALEYHKKRQERKAP